MLLHFPEDSVDPVGCAFSNVQVGSLLEKIDDHLAKKHAHVVMAVLHKVLLQQTKALEKKKECIVLFRVKV